MKLRVVLQKDFLIFWTFFFLLINSIHLFGNLVFLFECPFPLIDDMVTETCSSKQNNTAEGHQPRCENSSSNMQRYLNPCLQEKGLKYAGFHEALALMVMNSKGAYWYFQELPLYKMIME